MLTANGEVQTHEEAQVFVHDLNLFATVQLLDEPPAVLSLGKICEDRGYSCEWVSGQKRRLTKEEKTFIWKTDNFVHLVVPGLSTNPESSSSSASLSQDSLRKEAERATRQLVPLASSSSSSSVLERSDELATRTLVPFPEIQNHFFFLKKKGVTEKIRKIGFPRQSERNRIACIRTQFSAIRTRTSYDSGNEIKEAQYFYSLRTRPRLRCLLENHKNKGFLKKTYWRSSTSRRKVWWVDNGGSPCPQWGMSIQRQSVVRCRGSRSCHSMDLILSVQNKIFTWDGEKFVKILGAVAQTESCMYRQLDGILGKLVKVYHGIAALRHLIDPRQNGTAEWAVRQVNEGTSALLLQSGLVVRWWSDFLDCYCHLRLVQDLVGDGKTPCERRFGEPFKGPIIPFGALIEYHPISPKDQSRVHHFGKKILPGKFLGCELIAGEFGKVMFW